MTVDGLRTAQVGPSEQHEIQFNAYLLLQRHYAIAGHAVTEDVLLRDAEHLKRDLQRLRGARVDVRKPPKSSWWSRFLNR